MSAEVVNPPVLVAPAPTVHTRRFVRPGTRLGVALAVVMSIATMLVQPPSASAASSLDGGEAFLQATYSEVGVQANGIFGTTQSAPAGFHPRGPGDHLGFRVDRGKDGWDTGIDDGDFFTPGTPYESWSLVVGGSPAYNSNYETAIPGSLSGVSSADDAQAVTWSADADYAGVTVSQLYSVPDEGQALHDDVTLTNATGADVTDVYFMRGVDPDNNQSVSGDFSTTNTVVNQPTTGDRAQVSATQADDSYIALRSFDPRARAAYSTMGFPAQPDVASVWSGTNGFEGGVGSSTDGDNGINMAVNVGTLAAGETTTFRISYVLSETAVDEGNPNLGFDFATATVAESAGTAHLGVSMERVESTDVSVDYATTSSSADAGDDYTTTTGTLIVPAGSTTGVIDVPIIDDTDIEADETFDVTLSNPVGVTLLGGTTDTVRIVSDDFPTATLTGDASVAEAGSVVLPVTFSAPTAMAGSVSWSRTGGTTSPSDLISDSGTVPFEPGATSVDIPIDTSDDGTPEADETATISLSSASQVTIGAPGSATNSASVTIIDDDRPAVSLVSHAAVAETDGTTTFEATLDVPAAVAGTVNWTTSNGTAAAPGDFVAASGTLTFAAGEDHATFVVTVNHDHVVEPNEVFALTLSSPTNLTLDGDTINVTITSGDVPTASIIGPSTVAEGGGQAFTVVVDQAPLSDITIPLQVTGNATPGVDHVATVGSVTIPAGQTTASIDYSTLDDLVVEVPETTTITLLTGSGYQLDTAAHAATITIVDDDLPLVRFVTTDLAVPETVGTVSLDVEFDRPSPVAVSVGFVLESDTATAGLDITVPVPTGSAGTGGLTGLVGSLAAASTTSPVSGSITVPPGVTSGTITLTVVNDSVIEDVESLFVRLMATPTSALTTGPGVSTARITITDNDTPASLSAPTGPIPAGSSPVLSGQGYAPGSTIRISIVGSPTVITVVADADGRFSTVIDLPAGMSGKLEVHAVGVDPDGRRLDQIAVLGVTASATPEALALTGTDLDQQLMLAMSMVAMGAVLTRTRRRRAR